MGTSIRITPPGGVPQEIHWYDSVTVKRSSTNRAGSYSITMRAPDSSIIDAFPIGSVVEIEQDGHKFRGWVLNPAKKLKGPERTVVLEGPDYTARTQKIIVTESFQEKRIDYIVDALFSAYVPWVDRSKISECKTEISIKFADVYLWDAMETLCELSGYEWYIDYDLAVQFFRPVDRINPNVIRTGDFHRETANLKPESGNLVNRLWVKGAKGISDDYTQNITVNGTTPIPLYYTPLATADGVIVIINGQQKTVGIQHVHEEGVFDFLLNYAEKLLIPDRTTSGSGTITYRYEYPIKILLEEPESQTQYGLFEDVYTVDTTDRQIALQIGLRYLGKYSQPVMTGSIQPFQGVYHPGELVKVEIPELGVNEFLKIKSVTYTTKNPPQFTKDGKQYVERSLELESAERDLTNVLKQFEKRLRSLEKSVHAENEVVVRYIAESDEWGWSEEVQQAVHACPIPTDDETVFLSPTQPVMYGLFPREDLYPC